MKDRALLRTGLVGSVVAAVCCFTPALVLLLGALGLSAWLGWLDYVLLPALAAGLGLTAWAAYRLRAHGGIRRAPSPAPPAGREGGLGGDG